MEVGSALHLISLVVIILTDFLLLLFLMLHQEQFPGLVQGQVDVILACYLRSLHQSQSLP
jgi:hypothetical protein